ncbi:MAG: 16S rRNA (cytosine(967)-C(5))-methyltransferase RsmB, partial [Pseudomonadota bacterium]|nr:16S rRNA (cytosine(967)-C(5))-methyltransferase RsmB [Pseudomonadota bacterium]
TCSILPDENDSVIQHFLDQTTDASTVPIAADWGRATLFGRQCLPIEGGPDGFFYSRITKL